MRSRLPIIPDPIPPTLRDGERRRHSEVVPAVRTDDRAAARQARELEALAETAAQHVAAGERDQALRAACDVVDMLEDVRERCFATRTLVTLGEALVALGLYERAAPRLEEAVALADHARDVRLGARARQALGRAWLGMGEPSCRGLLEDAGELFESLGDGAAVAEIDRLLRIAASSIEPSPRSFHGVRR
jgi:hypothetical protein